MRRNIWIWNHYATSMYRDKAGRHYWFAENLIHNGYKPTIFCASSIHNSDNQIHTMEFKYTTDIIDNIPFVFVKTPRYKSNGYRRIINMAIFYKNLFYVSKEYCKLNGKPDIILASSVHPFTLVAGIKIARKFGIPCICEIRDLWPESFVAYHILSRKNPLLKLLYLGERWIYQHADRLIFTMEGGKDYLIEKGWNNENGGSIDLNKVHHINNGVDLEVYNYNKENYTIEDEDLANKNIFKVVYTGSIRLVNNVKQIIDVAKYIEDKGITNIKFLLFGEGTDKKLLEEYCNKNDINNVVFKGYVEKKYIPFILTNCDLNILHFNQNNLKRFGASLNKLFEYFASGKPIISDCKFAYDLIEKYKCGVVVDNDNKEYLAEQIINFSTMDSDKYNKYCNNALNAARDFDFKLLTEKLINVIES